MAIDYEELMIIPGWTEIDQLEHLFNETYRVSNTKLAKILEVGSWCGRSSIAIALALKQSGRGKLFCVDLWPEAKDWIQNLDESWSIRINENGSRALIGYDKQTVWNEPYQRSIAPVYEEFGSISKAFNFFINRFQVNEYIVKFKGHSYEWIRDFQDTLDGVFIDGDHSYDAIKLDLQSLIPRLNSDGFLILDDAFSVYQGVDKAIEEFINSNTDSFEAIRKIGRKTLSTKLKNSVLKN